MCASFVEGNLGTYRRVPRMSTLDPLNTISQVTTEVVFVPKKREDEELAKPGVNVLRYSVKIKSMPTTHYQVLLL